MKYIFIVIVCGLLAGCTFHLKSTDLEIEGKPVEPQLKMSNATYELTQIDFMKERVN